MKRIIRLTESDLTRIVKRVISEQSKTPMVDGGLRQNGGGALIALSQPTVTAGSGYRGTPSVQVKFNGVQLNSDGTVVRKGNIVGYAICGKVNDQSGGGAMVYNPAGLSLEGTSDVPAGNLFYFNDGSPISAAAKNFCISKGVKDLGKGITYDAKSAASSVYSKLAV